MLMYVAREEPLQGRPMWRALRNLALRIGNNEDLRELTRGVAMAFGWLIVSAILVLIAAIIVSAVF
jgi:cellobiose-specific phosphotransferase system component IIC